MPNINYIEIIKNAWQITWKNRFLWWFGLFISLSSPGINYNFNPVEHENSGSDKVMEFVSEHWQWIAVGVGVFLAAIIILMVLGIIARAGLIKSIHCVNKNSPIGFKQGMKEGRKYFWKLFLIGLAMLFLVFASIFILAVPVVFLIISESYTAGIALGLLAVLIFIPVIILVSFLKNYGYFYVVLGELSVWNAFEKAYELFQSNLLSSIVMGLLFIPIGIIFSLAVIVTLIPLAIIFFAIGFVLYMTIGTSGAVGAAVLGIICFLAILLILRSAYETFTQAVWYLFFSEIAKSKTEARILEKAVEKEEKVLPVADPVKTMEVEK